MPAKNVLKQLAEGCYYHVYNRGVDKNIIFNDDRDYQVFLYYLKRNLFPADDPDYEEVSNKVRPCQRTDLEKRIDLLCFCLMPNHFHFIVYLKEKSSLPSLMRRVCNGYVSYFNKRWARVGPLFQSRYKAVLVDDEDQLLHLSRYIHLNPTLRGKTPAQSKLGIYPYSSYSAYLGSINIRWLKPDTVLDYFRSGRNIGAKDMLSYQSFVEGFDEEITKAYISGLTLE